MLVTALQQKFIGFLKKMHAEFQHDEILLKSDIEEQLLKHCAA